MILKYVWFPYDHKSLYIANIVYTSWFAKLSISVYNAQNTIHLEFNSSLLIQCA